MNFVDYEGACTQLAHYRKIMGLEPLGSLIPNLEFGELYLNGFKRIAPGHFSYRYNPHDDLRGAVSSFKT